MKSILGCADCFLEFHELHEKQLIAEFEYKNSKVLKELNNFPEINKNVKKNLKYTPGT